jgi:DNA-binding SARP family transcriptional activator/TolB-like protein/Flp pilus assembly protein TadD
MLRLTLFGGLRIENEDGPLPGRASQRRRLALLALLASPPGQRTARDKLIAALWPDASDDRARRNLSSALYDLRAELGEDVVVATGDELALNQAVVPTDVAAFTAALEEGDLEGAAAAYAGPFLDGFFIDDADDFERWVEAERQRYARDYQQALLQLAEGHTAAGDVRAAADAWHRLSVADPFSARVAVGYMNALDVSGDRAGALRFARVHTALLREELAAEPSPEVVALAERLRDSPTVAIDDTAPHPASEAATATAAPAGAGADFTSADGSPPTTPAAPAPSTAPRATGPAPAAQAPPARRAAGLTLVAAGLVIAGLWLVFLVLSPRASHAPVAPENGIGVAVLPFQNLSGSADMDPFCDGLTEEIISGLGKVASLRIPSRTTMVLYQRRDVPPADVGQELGVRYWVEGTVRSEGARLRIAANLVDARTGSTVWRDQYDLQMVSLFDAQEEIAQAVVRAVAPQLAGTVGPLVDPTTRNTAAYTLYLKGRAHWYRRSPDDLTAALGFFTRALTEDPDYALAYSAIADVHNLLGAYDYGLAPPADVYPPARDAAMRALRLNPELSEAHAALANVLFNYDWDLAAAEQRYRRAIRANPGYGMARHWLSLLLAADGRHEEALREIYAARELDPRSPVLSSSLARHRYFRGEYELALEEFQYAIELDPHYVHAYLGAGLALVQMQEYEQALTQYRRAASIIGTAHPPTLALIGHAEGLAGRTERASVIRRQLSDLRAAGTYVAPHYLALVSVGLGDVQRALDLLDESMQERSASLLYARIDPLVDPLRSQPRFQAMLQAIKPGQPDSPGPATRVNARRQQVRLRSSAARWPTAAAGRRRDGSDRNRRRSPD